MVLLSIAAMLALSMFSGLGAAPTTRAREGNHDQADPHKTAGATASGGAASGEAAAEPGSPAPPQEQNGIVGGDAGPKDPKAGGATQGTQPAPGGVSDGGDNGGVSAASGESSEGSAASGSSFGCPPPVTSLTVNKSVTSVSAPGYAIGLEKTGSPSFIEMWEGESAQVTFDVMISVSCGSDYSISGNIYVNNTGDYAADVTAVSDTVWYKAGGPAWLPATGQSINTTVPTGDDAISTGSHTYSYSGTFSLPVPLSSVTSMSNLIEITISNHPTGTKTFSKRVDFTKPAPTCPPTLLLHDLETVDPASGLSWTVDSVRINGAPAPTTGPWALNPVGAPYHLSISKTVTGDSAGLYRIDNLAWIGDLQDDAAVEVLVKRRPLGSICGVKFLDQDCDGERDEGEPGLPGVVITLRWETALAQALLMPTSQQTTDDEGRYCFNGLFPGTYLVSEGGLPGYYPTTPAEVEVSVCWGSSATVDFGNCRYASISGTKWEDLDGDGQRGPQEPGIEGWQVTLDGEETVSTDQDGHYLFPQVGCGLHTVSEEAREGWHATTPDSVEVVLASGEERTVDFGNCRYASISGTKWDDPDSDGAHQPGEPGVPNVTITLTRGGAVVATALTAADGTYSFSGLMPGTYTVTETLPSGTVNTTPLSVTVNLASGQKLTGIDFLNVAVAGIVIVPPETPSTPTAGTTSQLPLTGFEQLSWLLAAAISLLLGMALLAAGLYAARRSRG